MSTTLGLDIGTTSIGWCLMHDRNGIIDAGSRIFPVGVQEDSYNKSFTEESKSIQRRMARGARRLNHRYKLRRRKLREMLVECDMLPDPSEVLTGKELYGLRKRALDGQVTPTELGRIFLLLNQRRGFKSSRKSQVAEDPKKLGETKSEMHEHTRLVREGGFRTIGEYFYSLYEQNASMENWRNPDEPVERIRDRFIFRKLYEEEFDAIWNAQKPYHPELLTDTLYQKIKLHVIYYQRPLKSAKHLVGKCRFEPTKRAAHVSTFPFQKFRLWQTLNNIRLTDAIRNQGPLTHQEKETLANALACRESIGKAEIKKLLGLGKMAAFGELERIKGNTTAAKLAKALGEQAYHALTSVQREKLWHILYLASDDEWLAEYLETKIERWLPGLSTEQKHALLETSFEDDYGRVSTKAIAKILPFLKQGMMYSEACTSAGYDHSRNDEDNSDRVLDEKIIRTNKEGDPITDLKNPLVMQTLSEMSRVVNAVIKRYGKPDTIRVELARSLNKSKKQREDVHKKNKDKQARREGHIAFLQERGFKSVSKGDLERFELFLELEHSETDLARLTTEVSSADFRKFAENVKPTDKTKYRLWHECGRISPYTGKPITLSALFSGAIEIEHILPYSRSMDNSFANKTLCERTFNAEKGNQTPAEYFSARPEEFRAFKERLKRLPDYKARRMLSALALEGNRPSDLANTSYAGKASVKILKRICKDVRSTNGAATARLRRLWGLNTILHNDGIDKKNRDDHRHHAVDAFVIANTSDWFINLLSQCSKLHNGRLDIEDLQTSEAGRALLQAAGAGVLMEADPLGLQEAVDPVTGEIHSGGIPGPYQVFRKDLEERLSRMFVSFRNNKRLISTRQNLYRYSRPKNGEKRRSVSTSVRGPLHEETIYGQIQNPWTGKMDFVVRKVVGSFTKLKEFEKIVDPAIRKILIDHVASHGGEANMKESMKREIFMISKDGKKRIPIRTVRCSGGSSKLIQLRPKENPNLFVDSGSNYCIGIYHDPETGKRDFQTVRFYDATQRALKKEPLLPKQKNGLPLECILRQKDLVVVYDKSADEIEWSDQQKLFNSLYRVRKFNFDLTNPYLVLDRHQVARIDDKNDREQFIRIQSSSNLRVILVRVDELGAIYR